MSSTFVRSKKKKVDNKTASVGKNASDNNKTTEEAAPSAVAAVVAVPPVEDEEQVPARSSSSGSAGRIAASLSSSSLLLKGTKPWMNGATITSSGLRGLDSLVLVCGGQPLGTCLLIEEDKWTTSLASTIVKYWCAEVSKMMRKSDEKGERLCAEMVLACCVYLLLLTTLNFRHVMICRRRLSLTTSICSSPS